jgi:glycerophosphoryl diester phosphodiesterase
MTIRYEYLDHVGPIPFAHRGGAHEGIENSLSAFDHAINLGYRYIETDVRASSDGALLIFHDATLRRLTDQSGTLRKMTHEEISRVQLQGKESIPTLEEALLSWPNVRFNVDVKEKETLLPLLSLLANKAYRPRICVGSFSHRRLQYVRRELPDVCTSASPFETFRILYAALRRDPSLLSAGPSAIQIPLKQYSSSYLDDQ